MFASARQIRVGATLLLFGLVTACGESTAATNSPSPQEHIVVATPSTSPKVTPSPMPSPIVPTPTLSPRPSPIPSPVPSPSPVASPSPVPTPPATTVTILNGPLAAKRGANATLQAKTAPSTPCTIQVDYSSGPSKAAGLGPATSSPTGAVSWTWKVGAKTTPGQWPITVTCDGGSASTYINVT